MIDVLNFSFTELIHTDVPNVTNVPKTIGEIRNIMYSAECLQLIRSSFNKAIRVNSGYRSSEVNKAVGGVKNSWHLHGLAYDITCIYSCDFDSFKACVQKFVDEHPYVIREHIVYDNFIHIAFKFN